MVLKKRLISLVTYGGDVPGSLTDSNVKGWNINHLNSPVNQKDVIDMEISGLNTAYLYIAMPGR